MRTPYTREFYSAYADLSYRSAATVVPIVNDILGQPKRIVDVGCGVGTWLRAWKELGAASVLGIDGAHVKADQLLIKKSEFLSMDLESPSVPNGAPFDLAQTLEVAEHLPPCVAPAYVEFLCSLSPVVLFSAAIPHQGGMSHRNEQWPEYWANLFDRNGYTIFDVIRPAVWNNTDVEYYYAQNAFIFADRERSTICSRLDQARASLGKMPLALVHPTKWGEQVAAIPRFDRLLSMLPRSAFWFGKRAVERLSQGRWWS